MTRLNQNWITEKLIDFEYKKYILLAYLKEVNENFEKNKLYPYFSELIEHYKQVKALKESKQSFLNSFPHRMTRLDLEKIMIEYERIVEDDNLMQELESIINYSIPQFEYYLSEGKKIYDFIEEQMNIYPVGLIPLYSDQGYMFLRSGNEPSTNVYEYRITIFEEPDVKYRGIHTRFITSFKNSITNTFESIKKEMISCYKSLPNPAAYVIETDLKLPVEETFLPIAKRVLVKKVAAA